MDYELIFEDFGFRFLNKEFQRDDLGSGVKVKELRALLKILESLSMIFFATISDAVSSVNCRINVGRCRFLYPQKDIFIRRFLFTLLLHVLYRLWYFSYHVMNNVIHIKMTIILQLFNSANNMNNSQITVCR